MTRSRSRALSLADPAALWRGRIEPGLDDYMGPIFEDVCRSWVARADTLPFRPSRLGSWWDAPTENEIDVVALGPTNEVLVGECKWGPACFSARGEWGGRVAKEIEAGSVLAFTAEDVLSLRER